MRCTKAGTLVFILVLLVPSWALATARTTPAANPAYPIIIPPVSGTHGPWTYQAAAFPYGTAGTLTAITGTTHANTTLDSVTNGHGITNGQYITIAGEVGAFRVTAGQGTNSLTLNRAATSSSAGLALQYTQRYTDVAELGYNVSGTYQNEPISVIGTEIDRLDTDGYRKSKFITEFFDEDHLTNVRPFVLYYNQDTSTFSQTQLMSGDNSLLLGCGFSVTNAANARQLLKICSDVGSDSWGTITTDAKFTVSTNGNNSTILTMYSTYTSGATNDYLKFDLNNASAAQVTFGAIGVNSTTRTASSEAGTMTIFVTKAGDWTFKPLILTGTAATLHSTVALIAPYTTSPASNAACTTGTFTWDTGFFYICTASGVWKRTALTGGY